MGKMYVPVWSKPNAKVAIESDATIGAQAGVNLLDAEGNILNDADILNSAVIQALQLQNGVAGVTAGTYGDSSHVGQFTVTALGFIKLAANVAISFTAIYGTPPTVTGSRGGNAALASLLTGLNTKGIIIDSSTP